GPADGEHLAGRVSLAEPAQRRLRRHVAGRAVPGERLRSLRHGRERLGVDRRRLRGIADDPLTVLRAPVRERSRGAVPAQGDQGRLPPVRAELLPALSAGGPSGGVRRHVDVPHRVSLRRPLVYGDVSFAPTRRVWPATRNRCGTSAVTSVQPFGPSWNATRGRGPLNASFGVPCTQNGACVSLMWPPFPVAPDQPRPSPR